MDGGGGRLKIRQWAGCPLVAVSLADGAKRGDRECDWATSRCRCIPIHRTWAETLKEDREAIILADKLGFYDAFMGEHLTDKAENITNSMIFNASVISDTKTIKLATGTSNLSHMHPVLVAQHAAMFDHLSEGRFIFGVSPARSPPTPKRSASWSRTATRCSPRRST